MQKKRLINIITLKLRISIETKTPYDQSYKRFYNLEGIYTIYHEKRLNIHNITLIRKQLNRKMDKENYRKGSLYGRQTYMFNEIYYYVPIRVAKI